MADLKLEVGLTYLTRTGTLVRILGSIAESDFAHRLGHRFIGKSILSGRWWDFTSNGSYLLNGKYHPLDLIRKATDEDVCAANRKKQLRREKIRISLARRSTAQFD